MASTSINIQAVKGGSEQHNKREKPLDYVRSELSQYNQYWESDTQSNRLSLIKERYHDSTGQRMQSKATPIREGVVVIQKSTTIQDLQRLAQAYEERFGVKVFQIALHKDEGYMHAKQWTPNLHAHLVFDWTDERGKTIKLNRSDMVEMQTITAEVLGMERGVASDKRHLSSLSFKVQAEETRLEEARKEIGEVENIRERIKEATEAKIKPIEAIIQDHTTKGWLGGSKTDYEAVIGQVKAQEEAKAIVKVSEQTAKEQSLQVQIASLQDNLRQERSRHRDTSHRLDQAKEEIKDKDRELNSLARFLRSYLREEGFEEFKEEAQQFFRKHLDKFLDLVDAVKMWAGGVIRDKQDNRYTADYENARLLINGKTIEQHLSSHGQKHDQEEEHKASRGFRR